MSDQYDELAEIILAIKEDDKLRDCFVRVLKFGSSTQQVRAANLQKELEAMNAPEDVLNFVKLLGDPKIAHVVLEEIQKQD
jgi:hypothetical protein